LAGKFGLEVIMKRMAFLTLLALLMIAALLSSCGTSRIQKLPTNNWQAQLTGGTGPAAALNFMVNFNLSLMNGSFAQAANISDFSFIKPSQCFSGSSVVVGSVTLTNNLNTNQINGSIALTIQSETGNVLTVSAVPPAGELIGLASDGAVTNGIANGLWTLTPSSNDSSQSACSASGSFIMCQNATSCSAALEPSMLPSPKMQ
jgi:hypothetical protein